MSQPFIAQIQPFGFTFAPKNWAQCNGQILPIAQNTALFSLLGTMYGGNGQTTFALPNLQSRVPMHAGTFLGGSYAQGQQAGEEQVTLAITTLPGHNHTFLGTANDANDTQPAVDAALAKIQQASGAGGDPYYAPDTTPQPLTSSSLAMVGGGQPHNNLQPYLTINWCICMFGIFPPRN
jgi:microcystin-dependent protein